jgi:hypothetical protein
MSRLKEALGRQAHHPRIILRTGEVARVDARYRALSPARNYNKPALRAPPWAAVCCGSAFSAVRA